MAGVKRFSSNVNRSFPSGAIRYAVLAAVLIGAESCADAAQPLQPPGATALAKIIEPASVRLNNDGQLADLATERPGELSGMQATELASVFAKQFVPYQQTYLEHVRGTSIDVRALAPCGRPLYSAASFEDLGDDVPAPYKRPYGAWWLVTLCAGNEPQVSVAVSAEATNLRIADGHIQFPLESGNEFVTYAIPVGHRGEYPMSPEIAAVAEANRTGLKVVAVPKLIMPAPDAGLPQESKWELVLNGFGTVQTLYTTTLNASANNHWTAHYTARREQPAGVQFLFGASPVPGEVSGSIQGRMQANLQTRLARRLAGRPLAFDNNDRRGN